jgi:hypothetical protein
VLLAENRTVSVFIMYLVLKFGATHPMRVQLLEQKAAYVLKVAASRPPTFGTEVHPLVISVVQEVIDLRSSVLSVCVGKLILTGTGRL